MNLSRRTSLSLLFVTLCTAPANAALSGDGGSAGFSIETAANSAAIQPLDQLLSGENNSDLFGSVLQQHATAAQPAISTMDGHFGGSGAEQPMAFGQQGPAGQTMPPAPSAPPAEVPNLSLTVAVHMGAATQGDSASVAALSPSTPASSGSYGTNDTTVTGDTGTPVAPVPLPAAGLLLASGLVALPAIRRKKQS